LFCQMPPPFAAALSPKPLRFASACFFESGFRWRKAGVVLELSLSTSLALQRLGWHGASDIHGGLRRLFLPLC
jgi:hypothetical protein